jgi:hypothetical protein
MQYLLGLVLLFGLAAPGNAQGTDAPYVGGGLGKASYGGSAGGAEAVPSRDGTALRILGGYRFRDRYGVEATFGTTADVQHTFEIFAVRGMAIKRWSRIGVYGGAGYYEASFDASVPQPVDLALEDPSGINIFRKHDDSGATVIAGVELNLPRVSLRGEYEWLDTGDALEASSVNALLVFRF